MSVDRPDLDDVPVTIIGHPFASIGMAEQLRSHVHACAAVHLHHKVFDIFRYSERTDPVHEDVMRGRECKVPPGGIRIFHMNGDEVANAIAAFEERGGSFAGGYNIIVPAWELPRYPEAWTDALRQFDEIWAISSFVRDSLAAAGLGAQVIGQSVELPRGPCLPRRYFGIRESAFVLLHFFDLSSYATRKNPHAVLELFARLMRDDPFRDIQLVLKAKNADRDAAEWVAAQEGLEHALVLSAPLDSLQVRSLINACDCFVSLHRAEGFGRGLGEAMALGRLALGTGWSGNLDFMTAENSLVVNHTARALEDGDYPHWEGQSWAEPDVAHAATLLEPVLADPARGAALARRGQLEVLTGFSHRAVGVRILERLEAIVADSPKLARLLAEEAAAAGDGVGAEAAA